MYYEVWQSVKQSYFSRWFAASEVIRLGEPVCQAFMRTDKAVAQELDDIEEADQIVEELEFAGEEQGVLVEE